MGSSSDGIPLFGRATELDRLRRWVQEVGHGRGRVVLIEGEAGIGKSALAAQATARAAEAGVRLLEAVALASEAARPFGVIIDALSAASRWCQPACDVVALAHAGPPSESEAATLRFRIMDAATDAFEAVAADGPVVVVLEDVHWADPSSVLTLRRLFRRAAALPMLVLLTARPTPRGPDLRRLVADLDPDENVVALGPLEQGSAVALAAASLRAEIGPLLAEKLRSTNGNPLFIRKLVEALDRDGALQRVESRVEVAAELLPPSLRLTILRTISFLSDPTLEVLKVASILGSTFSVSDLAVVLDTNVTSLLPSLGEASSARVLTETGDRMAFAHDLVRDAVYEDAPLPVRRALHAHAGHRLAGRGAPLLMVAEHFALGASTGDVEAVEWLRRTADDVGPRAPGVAARLLAQARALAGETYPDPTGLAVELVRWLVLGERFGEGERLARSLLAEGLAGPLAWRVRRDLGLALCFQGRLLEGVEAYESVLAEPSLPDHERAVFLADVAAARCWTFETDPAAGARAASEAEEAHLIATRVGAPLPLSMATNARACAAWISGDLARAEELAREATRLCVGHGAELLTRSPHAILAGILRDAEREDEAAEVADAARRLAEGLGDVFTLATMLLQDAHCQIRTGHWDDAVANLEASTVSFEEVGRSRSPFAAALSAYVAIHRNDLATADALAAAIPDDSPTVALLVRPLLAEAHGDIEGAVGLPANAHAAQLRILSTMGFLLEVARLCIVGGDAERARMLSESADDAAGRLGTRGAEGTALHLRGLLTDDVDLLLGALDLFRGAPRPLLRAMACEDAAAVLGRIGRREHALELVAEAAVVYQALGATRDLHRVDAVARALGATKGVRGPRGRPASGWDSLTPTERRVVELVTEGLTNRAVGDRLYVSRRTVESHMAHIFRKLHLSSRTELVAAATVRR